MTLATTQAVAYSIQHSTFNIPTLTHRTDNEEPPPIGKTWPRLYAAVLINLAVLIALFYAFTKAFQ